MTETADGAQSSSAAVPAAPADRAWQSPTPIPVPAPAPVFGWYIPAVPPAPVSVPPHPNSNTYPYAYTYPHPHPLAQQQYPYPAPMPGYGPGWYPPPTVWGPIRPPSFAKVPHAQPQPYLRLMRTVNYRWWRPILGLLAFVGSYVVAAVIVTLGFLAAGLKLDLTGGLDDLTDPAVLALANASLIVAIPAVWLAWVAHTERIGWSSSVLARIRWRLLWRYALIALVVMGLGILISLLVGGGIGPTSAFDGERYALLLVVVIISTPLQAAAEEYVFRGYVSQAIASWIPARLFGAVLAALITATLFSFAHAPGDFFTFFDRFAFGLAASAVVWLTGGLEAAIALHAANNVVIFLVVGALGGATASDIQAGPGTAALIVGLDVLAMGIYVWIVARTRERWHPEVLSRAWDRLPVRHVAPEPHLRPSTAGAGWAGPGPVG